MKVKQQFIQHYVMKDDVMRDDVKINVIMFQATTPNKLHRLMHETEFEIVGNTDVKLVQR
jgi:hypothetical protein